MRQGDRIQAEVDGLAFTLTGQPGECGGRFGIMATFEDRYAGVAGAATEEYGFLALRVILRFVGKGGRNLLFADHEADVLGRDLFIRCRQSIEREE